MLAELEVDRSGTMEVVDIEREVVRIGGSDDADVLLPGLQPHAATLLRSGDRWTLANRMVRAMRVGRRTIAAGSRGPVRMGELIQLRHDLLLRLRAPRENLASTKSTKPKATHSQLKTLCVLSLVVSSLVVLLMLPFLRDDGAEESRQRSISKHYHELSDDLLWATQDDAALQPLLIALQQGRMAELRREYPLASICYSQVAQSLLRERGGTGTQAPKLENRLVEFVKGRLRELAKNQTKGDVF